MGEVIVAASLLASDFGNLAGEAMRAVDAGCDVLHLDVMDGHFVPNLSMGPAVVSAVNRATDAFLDVHLMIYNPYDYIEPFVQAGADRITFHLEATEDIEETLAYIKRCNVQAGLAICPETDIGLVEPYVNSCDLILCMTVHPGFGGQKFMPEVLPKIEQCRQMSKKVAIQVDGGINQETAEKCYAAGANVFVAGTYLFEGDMKEKVVKLHGMA